MKIYISDFIIFFISIFLNYKFLKKLKIFLASDFLDKPNDRSSHQRATPRGGGIVFVISGLISSLLAIYRYSFHEIFIIPLILIPLALVGLIDDRKGLSPKIRFLTQILTGFLIIKISPIFNFFPDKVLSLFVFIFFLICISGIINFTNFMDGLDGLISGCLLVLLIVSIFKIENMSYLFPFIGALVAFLWINWHPAKIFMGDIGSTYLGALYIGNVLFTQNIQETIGLILLSFPIFADCIYCLTRRYLNGQNIFDSHKSHLYQRLHQAGLSHSQVSIIYIGTTILLSTTYLIWDLRFLIIAIGVVFIFGIWLEKNIAIPFNKL